MNSLSCMSAQKWERWKKRMPRITIPSTNMFLADQESALATLAVS